MLSVRQSEHFSFLGVNNQSNLSDMRCRTTFYTALGRLLMVDLGKYTHKLFSRLLFLLTADSDRLVLCQILLKNWFYWITEDSNRVSVTLLLIFSVCWSVSSRRFMFMSQVSIKVFQRMFEVSHRKRLIWQKRFGLTKADEELTCFRGSERKKRRRRSFHYEWQNKSQQTSLHCFLADGNGFSFFFFEVYQR